MVLEIDFDWESMKRKVMVTHTRMLKVCLLSFFFYFFYSSGVKANDSTKYTIKSLVDTGFIVSGYVKDSTGKPLSGVSVSILGKSRAAYTNNIGFFTLKEVVDGDSVVFYHLGYRRAEIPVAAEMNVVLIASSKDLEEVVVVNDGYRTSTRQNNVSAIGTVDGKIMANKPFASYEQTLQGQVAGVSVVGFSGQPGAEQNIRIRGLGSMALSSDPLIVVDGMIVNSGKLGYNATTANALAGINQNDIASVNVLKDAAATSLYGSRGSNGVIVITTKSGKNGKTQISADVEFGNSSPMDLPKAGRPLSADNYAELFREALRNSGSSDATIESLADSYGLNSGKSNDWYDLVTKTGSQAQYNISMNGGNEKTKIFASAGLFKQDATTIGSDFNKKSALFNIDHKINSRITFTAGINFSNVDQNTPYASSYYGNPTYAARVLRPFQLAYNEDGSVNTSIVGNTNFPGVYNPIYIAQHDIKHLSQTRILGNTKLRWNIWDKLYYTSYFSIDYNTLEETTFLNATMGDGRSLGGRSKNYYDRYFNWLTRNQLDYRYDIPNVDDFYITATAGYEAQKSKLYLLAADGYGFPSSQSELTALSNAATPVGTYGQYEGYAFNSFYSIASANYKGKYVLNTSFRRDGSSRFAVNNRFANFYSIGGAWNVDKEEFFQKQSIFSSFKLRSSYGITGNAGMGNYAWMPLVAYSGATGYSYDGITGQQYITPGNTDLKWERSKKFDAGVEMYFLKDRLSLVVDYYYNNIDGLIQNVSTSYTSGFSSANMNVGSMVNKGWEFTLMGNVIQSKDFSWYSNFNIAFNKNKVTSLAPQTSAQNGLYYLKEGYNYYTYYMKEYAGVDPQNGDPLYYVDDTHQATTNKIAEANYSILKKQSNPKYLGGWSNTFTYKGLSLSLDFNYSAGNYIYGASDVYLTSGAYYTFNKYQYIYDHRWTTVGQVTDVPKYSPSTDYSTSTYRLYKGDYIRLRNLSLGYDLANANLSLLKKYGINKLNIYARATNLLTILFDDRLPFDPEVSYSGYDQNNMPKYKTYTIGINVGF